MCQSEKERETFVCVRVRERDFCASHSKRERTNGNERMSVCVCEFKLVKLFDEQQTERWYLSIYICDQTYWDAVWCSSLICPWFEWPLHHKCASYLFRLVDTRHIGNCTAVASRLQHSWQYKDNGSGGRTYYKHQAVLAALLGAGAGVAMWLKNHKPAGIFPTYYCHKHHLKIKQCEFTLCMFL